MALKVIGAGLGRTGTLTLKAALETLGFGKCYHMVELLKKRSGIVHWENASKGEPVDWQQLFQGYQSAVDFPTYYHTDKLIEFYPNAKVILTTRDVDSWYDSVKKTILFKQPTLIQKIAIISRLPFDQNSRNMIKIANYIDSLINQQMASETQAKHLFLKHNDRILERVPINNLLVYDVKQGWEPLCKFLNCPVPNKKFPHINKREEFNSLLKPLLW